MSRPPPELPPPPLGEVLDFMRLIWALDHALQKSSRRMKATVGVTGPQRLVLRIVARFPGLPAGQIAELLHVHPSTLTGVLKRLQRQGFIHRRVDPKDRRRAFLGVTENGRRIAFSAEGTVESVVERLLGSTPRAKVEGAREVLKSLAAALDQPS
ncbi:MAG TPA: MarR family transcriptional regulator [Vicinamibacteria bacterium]